MKKLLGIFVTVVWVLLPLFSAAQNQRSDDDQRYDHGYRTSQARWEGRLSAEDQSRFDSYYSRWLDYRRTNNRGEIASMESRMRDVMAHYNIPSDVPFSQIASSNDQGYGAYRRGDGDNDDYRQGAYGNGQWRGRLSADDQRRFDSYYSRWLDYRRTNNRDEIASMENRMRDVMAHNSIPSNTEFSRIASPSAGGYSQPNIPRFSGDDARRFRSYYSRWQQYKRTNNRSEIASMEGRMQDVMNHHNIPSNVPYDDVMDMLNGQNRD